jgi:hypothetical protein
MEEKNKNNVILDSIKEAFVTAFAHAAGVFFTELGTSMTRLAIKEAFPSQYVPYNPSTQPYGTGTIYCSNQSETKNK